MKFLIDMGNTVAQSILAFYDFWVVWRVLLPILPGPADPLERIATLRHLLHGSAHQAVGSIFRMTERRASTLLLLGLAAAHAGLSRLVDTLSAGFIAVRFAESRLKYIMLNRDSCVLLHLPGQASYSIILLPPPEAIKEAMPPGPSATKLTDGAVMACRMMIFCDHLHVTGVTRWT
ncbi:MAG: hypothetical protein M3R24_28975 [Chloroflexota bacterium]|nr:hypothetical protein [Chloroflexota bacterium]